MDRTEYRQESRKTWNELAPMWDERSDQIGSPVLPVAEWLVERLDAQPGETILDIAAGAGVLSQAISPKVGDSGRVICTDFAPAMVEAARRRGDDLGLSNVEYREMDAEQMDLGDDSVDGAVCRFGYMLMADHVKAMSETRRVLRPGGRLVFAVWAEAMRNPWVLVPASVLLEQGHMQMPDPDAPGIFALGERGKIEAALAAAGLEPVEIADIDVEHRFDDREGLWTEASTMMGPIARAIGQLDDAQREAVREAINERVEQFRDDGGYRLAGAVNAVLARPVA
jgi:SAM-dependent methyltransferase